MLMLRDPCCKFFHVGAPQKAKKCVHFKPHMLSVETSSPYIAAIKLGSAPAEDRHQVSPPCVA